MLRLQTELDILRSMVAPADAEKAASLAAEAAAVSARVTGSSIELKEDIEADMSEKVSCCTTYDWLSITFRIAQSLSCERTSMARTPGDR